MLIVAATPIGNLGDASPRLGKALETAVLIVAEDTRRTKSLLRGLGITTTARFISANEHNESAVVSEILAVAQDHPVVLVSDAGMPLVSDPGYALVSGARERDVPLTVIPGPSSGISALAVSGLPTDRFVHEGFVPKKGRAGYLESLAREKRTMVFFESPNRLEATLRDMAQIMGPDRSACVARELTKMFEEIAWGSLAELAERFAGPVKGEIVIVVGGARAEQADLGTAVVEVQARVAQGEQLSVACVAVAKAHGLSKRDLYQRVLAASA